MQISNSKYYFINIRPAAILTTSYVPAVVLGGDNQQDSILQNLFTNNQLILYVAFTIGSLTNATLKIEFSNDGTTWYQETEDNLAASTGVITEVPITRIFTATGNYRIPIKMNDAYVRVSAEGVGTVTASSLSINAIVGNN